MKLLITSWVVIILLCGTFSMFKLGSVHDDWSMLGTTGLMMVGPILYVLAKWALAG